MIIVGGEEAVSSGEVVFLPKGGSLDGLTPKHLLFLGFDKKELSNYKEMVEKGIGVALHVSDLRELVYACNLGAKYAIAHKEDAISMQKAVENYMYDTKLLVIIYEEEEIEWAVTNEIDGVIFATEEME